MGTTLFSIGLGFAITVLPTLSQIIEQDKFNAELIRVLGNHTGISMNDSYSTASIEVLNGVTTYTLTLTIAGIVLLLAGMVSASLELRRLKNENK